MTFTRRFLVLTSLSAVLPVAFATTGGSNYAWYNVVDCVREPYYAIVNYDIPEVKSTVDAQLQQMYDNGQRNIRIPIFHTHGSGEKCVGPPGFRQTNMDSTGAWFAPQCMTNLVKFLQSVSSHGLTGIVGFFPSGDNIPQNWPSNWESDPYLSLLFQENWNLIYDLHSVITANFSGKIDLMNEGLPPGNLSQWQGWIRYDQLMWSNYTTVFGKSDTVGFSIPYNTPYSISSMMSIIYAWNDPVVFDIHLYPAIGQGFSMYSSAWTDLSTSGRGQGWIIGEAFYNDDNEAAELANAHAAYGNVVFFLTQWPQTRGSSCAADVVPLDFSNYLAHGF